MHDVSVGPGMYALIAFVWAGFIAAVMLVLDGLVRRRVAGFGTRARQLRWVVPQGVYAVLFLANQIPAVAAYTGTVVLALVAPALVMQVAYLLRVVYPRPERTSAPD
jgi:hypothetical protein